MISDPRLAPHWDRCWPMLAPAVALDPTTNRTFLESDIDAGRVQFWPASDCALITSIVTHRTGLKDCVVWFGGGGLRGLVRMQDMARRFARENHCDRLVVYGRRGWLRALSNAEEVMTIMIEDL